MQAVEKLVICCVDVIAKRKSDNKLLLFLRRDKPAQGIWWWPGGRMFRGESFYKCAVRKLAEESGTSANKIVPVGVIPVSWNTFFRDSAWDESRENGRQGNNKCFHFSMFIVYLLFFLIVFLIRIGCQTVNAVVVCEIEIDDQPLNNKANSEWAVEDHRWISIDEGLSGKFDRYVKLNIIAAKNASLL